MGFLDVIVPQKKKEETAASPVGKVPYEPVVPKVDKNINLPVSILKFKGAFDLDGVYKTMYKWLEDRQYEVHETMYKAKPPELEIEWTAERKKTG